jgi:hypothetical protein
MLQDITTKTGMHTIAQATTMMVRKRSILGNANAQKLFHRNSKANKLSLNVIKWYSTNKLKHN